MTVFDVGANVGDFAASALESNPQMSVHLFEPSGAAYRALQTRVFGGKVHLNFFGLSSSTREGILHVFADSSGINSLEKRVGLDVVQNATERIKLETLDGVCANSGISQIDLLKIDVEGHELEVLKGALRMLESGAVKRIQFEYGGTYIDSRTLLKDIFDLLIPLGYKMGKVLPDRVMLVEKYLQKFENYQYQNWVALHCGHLLNSVPVARN